MQRNTKLGDYEIDPVDDKVNGRKMLAQAAEMKEDFEGALEHYESALEISGFNATHPGYEMYCRNYKAHIAKLMNHQLEDTEESKNTIAGRLEISRRELEEILAA